MRLEPPEGITASVRNCRVSATAHENLRKIGTSNVVTHNRWTAPLKGSRTSSNAAGIDDLVSVPKSSWMVKAFLFAALILVVSGYPALAQDTKVSVGMTAIGGMSCAHWRATKEHLSEGTIWIYGFWTGLNYVAAASDQAQSGTDTAEIASEVEKNMCAGAVTVISQRRLDHLS